VNGDAVRLQQIIGNLLVNAAKYTDRGGQIHLEAERQRGQVIVRLRDTGQGIPPDRILEMFELFAQGERSLARSEGGLGLGLTIVRKLVELHGGKVTAESGGDGRGSEFTVRLPAASSREKLLQIPVIAPATAFTNGHSKNPKRILVVDDNRDSVEGLERLLKRRGCSVAVAYDGPEALEVAAQFCPEVVLLDIGLPGMDGYDVARRLRAQPEENPPLIVAISGYGQESDRRRALDAGFDLHLIKPIDFHYLKELLKLGA
jgi:CheY-like chemotaxis protein/anti-sigma regulatory factor (Ser/Thr protein kinase)